MKGYKCDICGSFFGSRLCPTLPNGLIIAIGTTGFRTSADICAGCLETLRNTVCDLSLITEENDEPETSSSEC